MTLESHPQQELFHILVLFSFPGVEPVGGSWTQQALTEMASFQDRPVHAKVVSTQGDTYELEIVDQNNTNLAEHLISKCVAKAPQKEGTNRTGKPQKFPDFLLLLKLI